MLCFDRPFQDLFIPDETAQVEALARTTHLGVGAHHDDLEFMAMHGILACHGRTDRWFGGITCTDGAGSARTGRYADFTDEQMKQVRVDEQREAALIGEYSFMAQLAHPSAVVKDPQLRRALCAELVTLLEATRPEVVYTHNPADKHATHIGVLLALVEAIRQLPPDLRPKQLIGCEVWRGLDWLCDRDKLVLDVSSKPELAARLNAVFDSQIAGGKRYDLAIEGRRRANATFLDSHSVDKSDQAIFALDLTPLIKDPALTLEDFLQPFLDRFQSQVTSTLRSLS